MGLGGDGLGKGSEGGAGHGFAFNNREDRGRGPGERRARKGMKVRVVCGALNDLGGKKEKARHSAYNRML